MSRSFHATCTLGLETVLAGELTALGAQHVRTDRGGVGFHGDLGMALRAVMWVRSASRIYELLFRDKPAGTREQLYDAVRAFDWRGILTPGQTFAVSAASSNSAQRNPQFLALVTKDAVVDAMRDLHGVRPDVDTEDPDVPLRLVVLHNRAMLLRDFAGGSLHRRGWRPIQVKSPLNEAIAAGLLLLTNWDRTSPLVDPMCGSGTFLIEAAHLACDRAPGLTARPAALRWPDVEAAAWDRLVEEAKERFQEGRKHAPPIFGADMHEGSVAIAQRSAHVAGVPHIVHIQHRAIADLTLDVEPGVVVTNPPWGMRIGQEDHEGSWRDLGTFLKTQVGTATAWILSGSPELTQSMRLKATERHPVHVGPIDCRWIRYDMRPRVVRPAPDSASTP